MNIPTLATFTATKPFLAIDFALEPLPAGDYTVRRTAFSRVNRSILVVISDADGMVVRVGNYGNNFKRAAFCVINLINKGS